METVVVMLLVFRLQSYAFFSR